MVARAAQNANYRLGSATGWIGGAEARGRGLYARGRSQSGRVRLMGAGPRKEPRKRGLGTQEPRIPHNAVATTDPRGRSSEYGFRTEKTKPFMVLSGLAPPEKRTSQNPNRTVTTPPAALWLAFNRPEGPS